MFFPGVWLLIAGVLLLGHTPAVAEAYLRVFKKGVIYYYFHNQGAGQPGINISGPPPHPTLLKEEALIREPSRRFNPPPAPVAAPLRGASQLPLAATSLPGAQRPDQSKAGTAAAPENIWAAIRYPIKMLAKLGCFYPSARPGDDGCSSRGDGPQGVPSPQKPQIIAPPERVNFLNYAREPRAAWGLGPPSPGGLIGSHLPGYCFPVAGPFSFRDTWGERRPGGRGHRAVDIFAREGTAIYAVTAGVIHTLTTYPGGGITLKMLGQDSRGYGYMHLLGYAPGIMEGKAVRAGELIGYVGRTGIRQGTAHLHFQVYADHNLGKNELLNPYLFLVQLCGGLGVEDLDRRRMARIEAPEIKTKGIQVYRRPDLAALRTQDGRSGPQDSTLLVITNHQGYLLAREP